MASIHALQGAPEHSAYAATKGAITACTRALAVEVGHRGIRINAIASGWIDGGTTALMSLLSDFRTESRARFGIGYMPGR